MLHHASAGGHPAGGNNDGRRLYVVDLLRVFDGAHKVHGVCVERVPAAFFLGKDQIVVLTVAHIQVGDADGHRAVHIDWKARDAVRVLKFTYDVHKCLCTSHGECRDHDPPAALGHAIDDVRHRIFGRAGRVLPVSVSGFAEQDVAARRRFRIFQDRLVVAPDIPGKQHDGFLSILRNRQLKAG